MTDNQVPDAAAKAADKETAERLSLFGRFGYTGADDEVVLLRSVDAGNGDGTTMLQAGVTANARDVWAIYKGLSRLEDEYTGQFHRVANSAYGNRRPVDVAKRLPQDEYGPLTDYNTGEWLPGRREIVIALLDLDENDMDASFAETPLIPRETAKAA